MTEEALKACPWPKCQGTDLGICRYGHMKRWFVRCYLCDARGPTGETESKAILLWNIRAGEAAQADALKRRIEELE